MIPAPITLADLLPANANIGKPRYNSMTDWSGGNVGDDVTYASAAVALASASGGAPAAAYTPRTQSEKATLMVPAGALAIDVARARGWIAPNEPYRAQPVPPAESPVITSLSPNTAVAGSGAALVVDIIGTGFTPWSTVTSGNYPIPVAYISPTLLRIAQFPRASVAGSVDVKVIDHSVLSVASPFVFT